MGEERVSEERLRHLAQHWPSEMRVVCHELIAAREELLALRAREERLRAALSALVRAIEDTWTHEDDCPAADGDDAPEDAECQCMPMAVDDALAALAGTAINSDAPPHEAGDPELAAAVARLDDVDTAILCDCVPKLPTPRRVRAALFYVDRYDRPTLRVEVRSEDTVDGRSGFLYAVGLDSMMEVTAALSGCMEGDFPGLVRLCAARERCAACDETCDYAWSDGRGGEHCVQPEPEDDVSIYRLILRDEEKRRAL